MLWFWNQTCDLLEWEWATGSIFSPNFKASDLGMLVVAVGRVMGVLVAALVAARLCIDSW